MVKIYLVRHGKAKKTAPGGDSGRPLSDKGRDEVSRMASFLGRSFRVSRIVHSGLLRATQTALILAETLGSGQMVEESSIPIGPMDDVEDFAEEIDAIFDDYDIPRPDGFYAFLEYVTQRRMSKEGRFCRVHFKMGATIDVVPPGSLASGKELVTLDGHRNAGWRFVSPDVDRLWREYRSGKRE